jgi:hypothetical protein
MKRAEDFLQVMKQAEAEALMSPNQSNPQQMKQAEEEETSQLQRLQ